MKSAVPQDQPQPYQPSQGNLISGFSQQQGASRKRLSEKCLLREKQRQKRLDCTLCGFFGGYLMNPHSSAVPAVGAMGLRERFRELSAAFSPSPSLPAAALCRWLSPVHSSIKQTSLGPQSLFPNHPISPGLVLGGCSACRL